MNNDFNNSHVGLLIQAFKKDPLFIKLFKGPKRFDQMKAFFKFIYKRNQLMNGIYLTDSSHAPTYVAFLETPRYKQKKTLLNKLILNLEMVKLLLYIPFKSLRFLSLYDKVTLKHRPSENHYYLTTIAVCPDKQGQGVGKNLFTTIHQIVNDDLKASSICLDTENIKNVSYYAYLGYDQNHEENLSDLTIYCMKKDLH